MKDRILEQNEFINLDCSQGFLSAITPEWAEQAEIKDAEIINGAPQGLIKFILYLNAQGIAWSAIPVRCLDRERVRLEFETDDSQALWLFQEMIKNLKSSDAVEVARWRHDQARREQWF